MKALDDISDLRAAIAAHADALAAGDHTAAVKFTHSGARKTYDPAAAEIARLPKPFTVEVLALARVGEQYISKLRTTGGDKKLMVLNRWRKEADGKWLIAEVEDISNKRSPWSDVPTLAAAAADAARARAENGNA